MYVTSGLKSMSLEVEKWDANWESCSVVLSGLTKIIGFDI